MFDKVKYSAQPGEQRRIFFSDAYSADSACFVFYLTHLVPVLPSYRNQSIDLHSKFLY